MPRGGLDPFFAPERIHVVTPPAGTDIETAPWNYPGVEQSGTSLGRFDAGSVARGDLVVLGVAMGELEGALGYVSESDAEAVLIPTWPDRERGPHDARQRLDPDPVALEQDPVALDQDGVPREEDGVALERIRERWSVPETVRGAITDAEARVMGPGAGIQMPDADGAGVESSHDGGAVAVVGDDPILASTVAERTEWQGSAVGAIVGVGAGIDIALGEIAGALAERHPIDLVMGHTGNVDSRFVQGLRAFDTQTPVAIQPAGGPPILAGEITIPGSDVAATLLQQAGTVPVDSLERMVDGAPALAGQPPPDPPSVVVVSNAGGPGVMAIDAVGESGLEVARMEAETISKLENVVPDHGSARNPLDLLADSDIEVFETVLSTALEDPNVGSAVVISAPNPLFAFENLASIIADTASRHDAPVVTALMGGEQTSGAADILRAAGIPNYFDPYRAVGALDLVLSHGAVIENRSREPSSPVGYSAEAALDRIEAGADRRLEGEDAAAFVEALGGPDTIDSGGPNDGLRMVLSAFRSPLRGPMVLVGVAEFAEAVGDVSVGAAPLSREAARGMLEGLRAEPLFGGARGQTAVATDPLLDLLQGVSHLLASRPEVREISFPGMHATERGLEVPTVTVGVGTRTTDPMPRG